MERGGQTEQCQVRNDKPVSMEQLFVIPKNTYSIWRKVTVYIICTEKVV